MKKVAKSINKIFIDTNIYLGFFNSNKPEFKKLLSSLIEIADKIITTSQIRDEINRNKLQVFIDSANSYLKQTNFNLTILPEHMDADDSSRLYQWNLERKKIGKQVEKSNSELKKIIIDMMKEIELSKDKVSIELSSLFQNSLKPSKSQLDKAFLRHKTGNPPGKYNNPIGDQINWILLCESVKDVSHLLIISNDQDFFQNYEGNFFLNSLLHEELLTVNPSLKVSIFNKLSEALREVSKNEKIKSLPPLNDLKKISDEEPFVLEKTRKLFFGGSAKPNTCPRCGEENSFSLGSYLKSKYGGYTYQYVCSNCGFNYDTGAPVNS